MLQKSMIFENKKNTTKFNPLNSVKAFLFFPIFLMGIVGMFCTAPLYAVSDAEIEVGGGGEIIGGGGGGEITTPCHQCALGYTCVSYNGCDCIKCVEDNACASIPNCKIGFIFNPQTCSCDPVVVTRPLCIRGQYFNVNSEICMDCPTQSGCFPKNDYANDAESLYSGITGCYVTNCESDNTVGNYTYTDKCNYSDNNIMATEDL